MVRSSYNNGSLLGVFQVQCICAKFTHLIWIYWLLMWYFVFLSNFGICYKCTVSYRYLLLRIAIHIGVPVSAVYRCAGVSFQPYSPPAFPFSWLLVLFLLYVIFCLCLGGQSQSLSRCYLQYFWFWPCISRFSDWRLSPQYECLFSERIVRYSVRSSRLNV